MKRWKRLLPFLAPALALTAVTALFLLLGGGKNSRSRVMSGVMINVPAGYECSYSDSRYAVYRYSGSDRNPGRLILDADIRDENAANYSTAEDVLTRCGWMDDRELYVNPHGVRMVRGHAEYSDHPEIRYYVETPHSVLLMCMIADTRYYSAEDCEAAMRETADGIRVDR